MLAQGTVYRCQSCQTEVEVVNVIQGGGPLVCCEMEMKQAEAYEDLWEKEAYDSEDFEWN